MWTLDDLVPEKIGKYTLPYPIRGGILRGIRVGIHMIFAGIATSIADGTLIGSVNFIPVAYAPAITIALGTLITSVDKYLREHKLQEEQDAVREEPLTDNNPQKLDEVDDTPIVPEGDDEAEPDPTEFDEPDTR